MEYTTIDRIFNKLSRELPNNVQFNETDVIEMIGEASDFLKVAPNQEQSLAFIEVSGGLAPLPKGLQQIIQVARDNTYTGSPNKRCSCPSPAEVVLEIVEEAEVFPVVTDCQGKILGDYEVVYYRPFFDLRYEYDMWLGSSYYGNSFTPIRLANHSFFNSEVIRNNGCTVYGEDEYTLIGTTERVMKLSFETGRIALAFYKAAVDEETGYPLIPDNVSYISAMTSYIKWKIAETYSWNDREGFSQKAAKFEREWLKYARQAKNYFKMPKGIDQHQNLMEAGNRLIPNHNRYYSFFGNLGRKESRGFFNPDGGLTGYGRSINVARSKSIGNGN